MAGNSAEPGRSVASKIIAILHAFTNGDLHSLTELSRSTGLPASTVHRLVTELAAGGVLERSEDAQYRVGIPLQMIGSRASVAPSTYEWARRTVHDLSAAIRADVRFGVLRDLEVAFIEKSAGSQTVTWASDSARLPAHASALGKALLAFSPPGTVDQVIAHGLSRFTPYTLTTADRLRRSLDEARATSVALSRWEFVVGETTLAAPVFGARGAVVAAVEARVHDAKELPLIKPALLVCVRGLSRMITLSQHGSRAVPAIREHLPASGRLGRV